MPSAGDAERPLPDARRRFATGPRTPEGLERCRKAPWKHGRYCAEQRALRRRIATLKRMGRLLDKMHREFERPAPDQRQLLIWDVEYALLEAELDTVATCGL